MAWTSRDFTVAEAAQIAGLHRATLDWQVHRARHVDFLFSEKRKHRRFFSPQDITALRLAHELERGGKDWLTAIAQAFEVLQQPPHADALLVVPVMSVSARSGRVITSLPDPIPTASFITLPIGKIAADIEAACEQLKETASVAV
ncbi:hypothetical protein ACLMJV_06835 [Sinorhizobium meliloti]|uniref:hypothetical protein n=1 Tax=Rhizobium meliloti TaxID=382 RepID=UPI00398D2F75